MGGFNAVGIIVPLVIWFIVLFVIIFIIRYALDSSKTSRQVRELADELRMLRQELMHRDERDRREKEEASGRVIDTQV